MEMKFQDTICAPATSVGGGAVSMVRVSGTDSFAIVDSVVRLRRGNVSSAPGQSIRFGEVEGVDDVLVSVFRAPHSYTGEDSCEITCHASSYIVREILDRLCEKGCRLADPGEFTRRAFVNGKMDLAQAEAVADLIASDSEASHNLALSQLRGSYSTTFRALRDSLVELCALVELELDFSEEEVEFASRERLSELLASALARIEALLASYKVGNAVKNGVPVAIVGAPNSGKSTLLNALLGEDRALVSDIPGTTRDTVEETVIIDGIKYRFIDTAGIRESSDVVEKMGIGRSIEKLRSASVVICLVDATTGDTSVLEQVRDQAERLIVVWNKVDATDGGTAVGCTAGGSAIDCACAREVADGNVAIGCACAREVADDALCISAKCGQGLDDDALEISAKNGQGLDDLRAALSARFDGVDLSGSSAIVTSARHHALLSQAASDLRKAAQAVSLGISGDLLAMDLRSATSSLSSIFGEITTDELLGEIFGRFCIGK